jgi:transposase-like protein
MADESMVALREALGKIMESEHADLLRESVALVVCEVMELEASERAGAERYERSAERSRYAMGTARGSGIRVSARSTWRSRSCGRAAICRVS